MFEHNAVGTLLKDRRREICRREPRAVRRTHPDANRGDCKGSIRFHGVVYVYDTRLNQAAPQGRTIGHGAVMDCDHRTVVDRRVVSRVKGAHSSLAIRIGHGAWHGIYVAENLSREEWPTVVREH